MNTRKPKGYDINAWVRASSYHLQRWAYYIKKRDGNICKLCLNECTEENEAECHHICPQSERPDLALELENGVVLCESCHLAIVHSSKSNHNQFKSMFLRWTRRKANKLFNQSIQPRLDKYKIKLGWK